MCRLGSSRKKSFMGGGGYIIFSMIYPWTFRILTPWTRVSPLDKHQIDPLDTKNYPWTMQIYPLDIAIFEGFPWTPGQIILHPPWTIFFLEEPNLESYKSSNNKVRIYEHSKKAVFKRSIDARYYHTLLPWKQWWFTVNLRVFHKKFSFFYHILYSVQIIKARANIWNWENLINIFGIKCLYHFLSGLPWFIPKRCLFLQNCSYLK